MNIQCPKCKIIIGDSWAGNNCPGCGHLLEAAPTSEETAWVGEAETALQHTMNAFARATHAGDDYARDCLYQSLNYLRDALATKRRLVRRWSIRNHLGHEVGTVETEHDPIAAYAVNVNAPSSRLKDAGYTATEAPNDSSSGAAN